MNDSFGFDLKSLEIFVHTVDTGNMTATAELLGTTQSAVSQHLSNLEKSLKVQLLDRSVRPLTVTTAGRFFYDSARKMLLLAHKTNVDISQARYSQLDHVNISIVDSMVTSLGPALVATLEANVASWSIDTGLSHLHANKLLSRNVDLILSDDALDEHAELQRRRILQEPFVLAVPKKIALRAEQIPAMMKKLAFVRYSESTLIGMTVERYLTRMSLRLPEKLQLDNTFSILNTVSAGLGWTITTPLCLFQSHACPLALDYFPLPGEPLYRNLTLVNRNYQNWNLPEIIAKKCCATLSQDFAQFVRQNLPWITGQIEIGGLNGI